MSLSVLMSVFAKEKPDYLKACLMSLVNQSVRANEVILVEDGPISKDLSSIIEEFRDELNIVSIRLPVNLGLGKALNEGLKHCKHELVARMDTDDIALPERFNKQIAFMNKNPHVAAASGVLEEWDETIERKLGVRVLPRAHEEIVNFAKRRSPLSHPLTIFRKTIVLSVGGYPEFRKGQDYALWSVLLSKGYKLANLPDVLLIMRTGDQMLSRRGWSYFKEEYKLLRFQRSIGFLSKTDFFINLFLKGVLRASPSILKRWAYKAAR